MKPLPHPRYDQALKRILARAHSGFLPLVLPGAHWIGELATDLPSTPRIVDLLWEVEYLLTRIIVHIELQTRADDDIGLRMADYTIQIYRRYRLPMISIVIYLRPDPNIIITPFTIGTTGRQQLICNYDIIKLWEIDADVVLNSDDPYLWPLAGLTAEVTETSVRHTLAQIAAADLPRQERGELVGLLGLLAGLRLPKAVVTHLLRSTPMIEDIWKDSSFPEAVYDIGVEDGEKRGQQAGQLLTLQLLAHEAITTRFPDVAPEVLARIDAVTDAVVLRRIIMEKEQIANAAELTTILDEAEGAQPGE